MSQTAIPYMHIRGGSSKGLYFLASDLPAEPALRERVLLAAMGRDERQIDGLGGADPLTSKVGIVSLSERDDAQVDYLFVQVVVGEDRVDTVPTCGNILAGIGPFAIEAGLVNTTGDVTRVPVYMVNSGKVCELVLSTPNGEISYLGNTKIDGVPGTSAPIICNYKDIAGSTTGALLPTGNIIDLVDGIEVTCIDNGMPVVVLRAEDMGIRGDESPEELNRNQTLNAKLQSIRLRLGPMMGLGDVDGAAIPKMCMISPARGDGMVNTRTFIPYKCHAAIGVLGAVSVAAACILPGSIAEGIAKVPTGNQLNLSLEHPSGELSVSLEIDNSGAQPTIKNAGIVRTARLLSRGEVYVPSSLFQ